METKQLTNKTKGQKMAYEGKVKLKETWEKLEDLIKEQPGQSAFAFQVGHDYTLMVDTGNDTFEIGMYWVANPTKPTEPTAGQYLDPGRQATYRPSSGNYLWVKIRGPKHDVSVAVQEIPQE